MRKIAIIAVAWLALLLTNGDNSAMGKPKPGEPSQYAKKAESHHKKAHKKSRHRYGHERRPHYKKGKKAHRHHVRHVRREVVYRRGGPPPWAPAHGYRYGHRRIRGAVVYGAPFGIAAGTCNREVLGAALGATGGGFLAAELSKGDPAAIIGGLIAGALIGGALADAVGGIDQNCVGQVLEHAPSRQVVTWRDPDGDAGYAVTPTRTYEDDGGQYCREYQTVVSIGGREESAYGTACRQPDGSWRPE